MLRGVVMNDAADDAAKPRIFPSIQRIKTVVVPLVKGFLIHAASL
jgi:hypothetical protein